MLKQAPVFTVQDGVPVEKKINLAFAASGLTATLEECAGRARGYRRAVRHDRDNDDRGSDK